MGSALSIHHRLLGYLRSQWLTIRRSVFMGARNAEPKMVAFGALGFFGFPLYYVIFKWVFPQPYESISLRVIGSLLFLPLLFVHQWPMRWRQWIPLYWYVSVTFAVPFFFTYMMLMNQATTVWLLAHLTSVFLILLLFDLRSFMATTLIGTSLAVLAFALTPHVPLDQALMLESATIWSFALLAGAIFSVSEQRVVQSKIDTLVAASGNVAHELRTPLTTLRMTVMTLQQSVPRLIGATRPTIDGAPGNRPDAAAHAAPSIRENQLGKLIDDSLRIAGAEVAHMHTVIDMLLMTVRPSRADQSDSLSASAIIRQAVERYPFASDLERKRVTPHIGPDFRFRGSEQIAVHILFNLIKNALFNTGRAGKGEVEIRTLITDDSAQIIVHDTGSGIPPGFAAYIFDRFVTEGGEEGLGIGLSFCKDAMNSMGGSIECISRHGEYTTFILHFPPHSDALKEEP